MKAKPIPKTKEESRIEREIEHKGMEVRIRGKGFLGFSERGEGRGWGST